MFKKNSFGFLVSFCIAIILLSTLKPDILPQSKDKITKWPEPKFEKFKGDTEFVLDIKFSIAKVIL